MSEFNLFTSESVSAGHPDKMADRISDAVLDAALTIDVHARVACETLIKSNLVVVAGEISSKTCPGIIEQIDLEHLVRKVVRKIGYDDPALGFDADSCDILPMLSQQSQDIAKGIQDNEAGELGAGDQGLMFGYATNETDVKMPAPVTYAHRLMQRQAEVRCNEIIDWLRPDAKSQVTLRYDRNTGESSVNTVVLSTQHDPELSGQKWQSKVIEEAVLEEIIKPVLGEKLTSDTQVIINPAGSFVVGGPLGDCGLTGRKIIVDTYGGMARHGGGAFSGKDPSKVDRSAAYAARHVAKNIVAAGLADKCEIQISYAISRIEPVSVSLNTFNTSHFSEQQLETLVNQCFDLTPAGIIKHLKLKRPVYEATAAYGHFGREEQAFTWEYLDKVNELQAASRKL